MGKRNLWFCGDTHGSLEHIVEHVLSAHAAGQAPAAIILLGDIDAPRPLHIELAVIRKLTQIFWIHGNHDSDDNLAWNNLVASELSNASLHCRVAQVGSWQVAGLGGIFRRRIWSPPEGPTFPSYEAWRADLISRRPPKDFGLAETAEERRHKTSIFPECVAGLERLRADILVSHEAPECRDDGRGWRAIDDLARALGVRYAFHGHHHDSPDYSKSFSPMGFEAYAVGFRGITALEREGRVKVIRPGDYDAAGNMRWEEGDDE
jgi:Icc-related predicted phosphoesterase